MGFQAPSPIVMPQSSGGSDFSYQASQAMLQRPWYQQLMTQWGHPQTLNDQQKSQILTQAQADPALSQFGIFKNGDSEISDTGMVRPQGHFLRDAALATGAFAGAGGFAALGAAGKAAGVGTSLLAKTAGDPGVNSVANPSTSDTTGTSGTSGNVMKALAALGGLIAGHELSGNGSQNVPPQLSQLLQMSVDRAAYQNPLVQAQTQGVYKMLPNFARTGTALSGSLSNQAPAAPAPTSNTSGHGGGTDALLAALGIGGGIGLGGALTGTNPYGTILDGIKKIFGGGGSDTTGAYNGVGTSGYPMPGETGFNNPLPPTVDGTNANDGFDPTQMLG